MTAVRYWAGARAAAGTEQDDVSVPTLADALELLGAKHGERLARIFEVCSFVVDGNPVGRRPSADVRLDGAELVDVLPPFAGG